MAFRCALLLILIIPAICSPTSLALGQDEPITRDNDPLREITDPLELEMRLKDGSDLIVVPNLTVEQFFELRDRARNASSNFSLESLAVQAIVKGDHAELEADYEYRFDSGEVNADIPLSFGTVQVGVDETKQSFDAAGISGSIRATETGYRWNVQSEQAVKTSPQGLLNLRGKTKIRRESGRSTLRILLPIKNCKVRIQLPDGAIDPRVRMDDFLETEETEEGTTVSVDTRGGDFSLSWRNRSTIEEASTIEAESETTFDVGVPSDYWDASTDLTLRWAGNIQSNSVRVALPPNAAWRILPRENDFDRYQIRVIAPQQSATDDSGLLLSTDAELLIENEDPQANPVIKLQLEWRWLPVGDKAEDLTFSTPVESVTVSGVDRHTGNVLIACPDSYSVIYSEKTGVRLEQQSSFVDSFSKQRLKFRFTEQNFGLELLFREQTKIPTVRPTYLVSVDENSLRMTAWLDCTFDSSQRIQTLDMLFGMWVPEENTAVSLVDFDDPYGLGETLQVLPLTDGLSYRVSRTESESDISRGQRRTRQLWKITAERSWRPEENLLEFSLPQIRKSTNLQADHCSGSLIVSSEGRVLLDWAETPFRGLIRDDASADFQKYWVPAKAARSPSAFRFQPQGQVVPTWSGAVSLLPQIVAWSESVNVSLVDQAFSLRQDFDLQIANAAIVQPEFAIEALSDSIQPQFFVDGVLVFAEPIGWTSDLATYRSTGSLTPVRSESSPQRWKLYRIIDSPPLIGSALLTVITDCEQSTNAIDSDLGQEDTEEQMEGAAVNQMTVAPLAVPILPSNSVFGLRTIIASGNDDTPILFAPSPSSQTVQLPTSEALNLNKQTTTITLRKNPVEDVVQSGLRIVDSWLQTAVSQNERQDRYACILEIQRETLRFTLPPNASLRPPPRVFLDGTEIIDATYDASTETFEIPVTTKLDSDSPDEDTNSSSRDSQRKFEVIYSVRNQLENWSRLAVQIPTIEDSVHVGRLQWQLGTPRLQHLFWTSNENVPEWTWDWSGLWWYRKSARDERQLVAAFQTTPERLPASFNSYLMSKSDPAGGFEAIIIARSMIWFPAGLFAIALAVLFLNFPQFRQPSVVLLTAACVLGLSILSPDLAVLMAQTCFAAGSLAVLAWLTHVALESRVKRRSVFGSRMPQDGSGQTSALRSTRTSQPVDVESLPNGATESSVAAEGSS